MTDQPSAISARRVTRRRLAARSATLAITPALTLSLSGLASYPRAAGASRAAPAGTTPEAGWDLAALGLTFEEVATGLSNPLWITSPPGDSRLFVVEQTGTIRIVQDGALLPDPFLDISDRITTQGAEQGLLGLAFHPDYATNGAFYVYYTDTAGTVVVSRFGVSGDPNVADPASEVVTLTQAEPYPNHNGGAILFGPDGYLYLGIGDGGSAGDPQGNGQNLGTWLGKLLRIKPDPAAVTDAPQYAIPGDNPFVDTAGALPEVWSYGLRNPWRVSFDSATGDLWIADVGQNEWEEIDRAAAGSPGGENYGWSIREGAHCFRAETCDTDGLIDPVAEYSHSEGVSVTGGYVYHGTAIPELDGTYLYADFGTGLLWGLRPAGDGTYVASAPIETGFNVASFGQGNDGELYLALFGQDGGSIVRLAPAG
jgi:glucose/arabinose dehydrogenase